MTLLVLATILVIQGIQPECVHMCVHVHVHVCEESENGLNAYVMTDRVCEGGGAGRSGMRLLLWGNVFFILLKLGVILLKNLTVSLNISLKLF